MLSLGGLVDPGRDARRRSPGQRRSRALADRATGTSGSTVLRLPAGSRNRWAVPPRRRRMSAVARTTLAAAVFGVAMIACAATVIRSQDYLHHSSSAVRRAMGPPRSSVRAKSPDPDALAALNDDSRRRGIRSLVRRAARGRRRRDRGRGDRAPQGIDRADDPQRPSDRRTTGEVVLSPAVMEQPSICIIGDSVAVRSSDTTGALTIVGTGVPVSVGATAAMSERS